MGGSDSNGLTLTAIDALESIDLEFNVIIMIGPAFRLEQTLQRRLTATRHQYEIASNVKNVAQLMSQADLAIAAFGVSAYELAAMGVPAIHICATPDHAESATAFTDAGISLSLGVPNRLTQEQLKINVMNLLQNPSNRAIMRERAQNLIDGRGSSRIADIITGSLAFHIQHNKRGS